MAEDDENAGEATDVLAEDESGIASQGVVREMHKAAVLYMDEALLDTGAEEPKGAACSKCMMFLSDVSECSILKPASVNGRRGVCGLFVGGDAATSEDHPPMKLIPREVAGYTEDGPTRCLNCKNFNPPNGCTVVDGRDEANGCCNAWGAKG